jgi:hypothetical protein
LCWGLKKRIFLAQLLAFTALSGGRAVSAGDYDWTIFGCGGMKPEKLQLGNVDCMALKL